MDAETEYGLTDALDFMAHEGPIAAMIAYRADGVRCMVEGCILHFHRSANKIDVIKAGGSNEVLTIPVKDIEDVFISWRFATLNGGPSDRCHR